MELVVLVRLVHLKTGKGGVRSLEEKVGYVAQGHGLAAGGYLACKERKSLLLWHETDGKRRRSPLLVGAGRAVAAEVATKIAPPFPAGGAGAVGTGTTITPVAPELAVAPALRTVGAIAPIAPEVPAPSATLAFVVAIALESRGAATEVFKLMLRRILRPGGGEGERSEWIVLLVGVVVHGLRSPGVPELAKTQ